MFTKIMSRLVASLAAKAIIIALGGGGTIVTAVMAVLSDGSLPSLGLLFVSGAVLSVGIFAAYRSSNPPPADEELREMRRNRVERWRVRIANRTRRRERVHPGTSPLTESGLYIEMKPHLSPGVRERFERGVEERDDGIDSARFTKGGDPLATMLLEEVARLEREWDLV